MKMILNMYHSYKKGLQGLFRGRHNLSMPQSRNAHLEVRGFCDKGCIAKTSALLVLSILTFALPCSAQTCSNPSFSKAYPAIPRLEVKSHIDKGPATLQDFDKWSQPVLLVNEKSSIETPAVIDRDYNRTTVWTPSEVYPYSYLRPVIGIGVGFKQFTVKLGERIFALPPSTTHVGAFTLTPELLTALEAWNQQARVYAAVDSDFFVDTINWAIGSGTFVAWQKIHNMRPGCAPNQGVGW